MIPETLTEELYNTFVDQSSGMPVTVNFAANSVRQSPLFLNIHESLLASSPDVRALAQLVRITGLTVLLTPSKGYAISCDTQTGIERLNELLDITHNAAHGILRHLNSFAHDNRTRRPFAFLNTEFADHTRAHSPLGERARFLLKLPHTLLALPANRCC